MVKLLLQKGANVNAKTPSGWTALTWAAWSGSSDVVKLLEGRVAAKTLMDAACLGDLKLLQQLIKKGADVNMKTLDERTPLMCAARGGHLDVVKALIALGADVNAKTIYGHTALMEAAEKGNLGIVKALLDKGADVNYRRW